MLETQQVLEKEKGNRTTNEKKPGMEAIDLMSLSKKNEMQKEMTESFWV